MFSWALNTARSAELSLLVAAWSMARRAPASSVTWTRVSRVRSWAASAAETRASSWLMNSPDSVLLMTASDPVAADALVRLAFSLTKRLTSSDRTLLNAPNTAVGWMARAVMAGRIWFRPWMLPSICWITVSSAVVAAFLVAAPFILAWNEGKAWVVAFWAAARVALLAAVGAAR